MKIESRLLAHDQWLVLKDLEEDYDQKSPLEEGTISIRGECLERIKSYQLSTKGFMLLDMQLFFTEPETELVEISGDCIVMNFIYGNSTAARGEVHHIWSAHDYKATFRRQPFQQINYLAVVLSKDFYFSMINDGSELHQEFPRNIDYENTDLDSGYLPFSPAIKWVIHEIRNCKRKGVLKRMYIETKIKELLLLQLEMLIEKTVDTKVSIEQADFHKLQQARSILEAEYAKAPTIAELSRKISLNEFKLKKGFKMCFGTTVRSYVIKLRMQHAKELFKFKNLSVSEVAYKCGYKDVSHFSAAFKAFYGFSPQRFKISSNLINGWITALLWLSVF